MHQLDSQYHFVERASLDLRGGILWQLIIKLLLHQTKYGAVADSSCPACTLLATCLAGPHKLQILHATTAIESDLFRQAEVNDVVNSKNCDRALRDIGRENNTEAATWFRMQFACNFLVQNGRMHEQHIKVILDTRLAKKCV